MFNVLKIVSETGRFGNSYKDEALKAGETIKIEVSISKNKIN